MKVIKILFFGLILTLVLDLNSMSPPSSPEYRKTPPPGIVDDDFDVEAQLPAAAPRRARRRQSICLLTTSNEGRLVPEDQRQRRRISLALSALNDDDEPASENYIPALDIPEECQLTTQLPLNASPREQEAIARAINDINQEQDPYEQSRKSTIFLANLQVRHTQKSESMMKESTDKLQDTLDQLEKGIHSLQETEKTMQITLAQTLSIQKRLGKMAYIGYFFGICSLSFFIYNNLTSYDSEQQ